MNWMAQITLIDVHPAANLDACNSSDNQLESFDKRCERDLRRRVFLANDDHRFALNPS